METMLIKQSDENNKVKPQRFLMIVWQYVYDNYSIELYPLP
jgi:hypothetical protein